MFLVGLYEVKMRLLICTNDIRSACVLSGFLVRNMFYTVIFRIEKLAIFRNVLLKTFIVGTR